MRFNQGGIQFRQQAVTARRDCHYLQYQAECPSGETPLKEPAARLQPLIVTANLVIKRRFTMALAAPDVGDTPTTGSSTEIVVRLSTLEKGRLEVRVPDSADLFLTGVVYAILGEDEEAPEWSGGDDGISAGTWNYDIEDFQRVPGLKVFIPENVLKPYTGQTVTLRYQTIGESSLAMSSSPVTLRIEP
ncbi:hypothetical protein [Pseudomonas fluorescens]|uniref:Uncharacterized protein n=1 Tax=Pseudomonas fluorescens TaxID=294 RepID=A0A5E7D526_PSEFL|nr:hypothetical protein [Pseudomonas fluorescens]VVO12146.1 hypothetical protein PS833_03520 [Pseudomonas fluorescens]